QALEGHRQSRPGWSAAVDPVTGHRVAERRHVHPDLVSPPGLESDVEVAEVRETLEHGEPSHRGFAPPAWQDGHAHTIVRMSAERPVHHATAGTHPPVDDGPVAPRDRARDA